MPDESFDKLKESLAFSYAHSAATLAPSKMTATQRKGRTKDQEAAENAQEKRQVTHSWRRPSFAEAKVAGKTYGNAIHSVMQYIPYEKCTDIGSVDAQIKLLAEKGFVTSEAAELANRSQIVSFFQTAIGEKLRSGVDHVREFKFSILDDGENYGDGLEGEKVLLQGVVDCAMVEDDGITILDFKTDAVTAFTIQDKVRQYAPQVSTYAHALEEIFQKPVKAAYLYFFKLAQLEKIL